jgi:hypothetical protein
VSYVDNASLVVQMADRDDAQRNSALSQDSSHRTKFVPAFITFVAAAIFGVGVSQFVNREHPSGIGLAVLGILLFVLGYIWNKLTTILPTQIAKTAVAASLDFRSWLIMVLLIASYLVALPFLQTRQELLANVLTAENMPFEGRPLGIMWASLTLSVTRLQSGPPQILVFTFMGKNLGEQEIPLRDAYMISGITGESLSLGVSTPPSPPIPISDAGPVPKYAWAQFTASFGAGITETEFLEKWQNFSVVIKYGDNETVRHYVDSETVMQLLSVLNPGSEPHITRKIHQ